MKKIVSVLLSVILIISISCITGNAQEVVPSFEVVGGSAKVGETVDVNIKINNNPGITSLQVKVEYSNKDLELVEFDDKQLFGNPVTHSDMSKNPMIISWFDSNSTNKTNNGILATLRFRIKDNAESSNISLTYDSDDVFNINFDNVDFQIVNGTVNIKSDSPQFSVSSESGNINDTVDVKVLIENNPSITALRISLAYSTTDLELLEINNGGVFEEAITHSQTLSSPITISWYSQNSQDCNNNGILATLKFRIKENASSSEISLSYDEDDVFNSSFDNVYFETQNGTVSVLEQSYLLGDTNGDGIVNIRDVTAIQRHLVELEPLTGVYLTAADSNCDGTLDISDATTLQMFLAEYSIPYPIGEPLSQYSIKFNATGGELKKNSITAFSNTAIGDMPVPDREYYNFEGWFTERDGGTLITPETVLSRSDELQLYAHWTPIPFTILFDANEGSVATAEIQGYCNQALGDLPTPTRTNYNFDGWFTAKEGGDQITSETILARTDNLQLYAHWTLNSFVITLNANEGSVTTTEIRGYCNQAIGNLPTPTRDYYSFDGWFTDSSGGEPVTADSVYSTANDFTAYAHWTIKPVSDWVEESQMPAGAQITNSKWTYTEREYTSNSASSLSGWTKYDTKRTSWGSTQGPVYSDPSNGSRNVWSESYVTSSNYKTIYHYYRYSTQWSGTYGSDMATDRYGHNYYSYDLDYELTDLGTQGNYSQGYRYYYNGTNYMTVWKCDPFTSQQWISDNYGTRWYYQDPVYTYYYYRDVNKEATSDPTGTANVSNIKKWVQYREK